MQQYNVLQHCFKMWSLIDPTQIIDLYGQKSNWMQRLFMISPKKKRKRKTTQSAISICATLSSVWSRHTFKQQCKLSLLYLQESTTQSRICMHRKKTVRICYKNSTLSRFTHLDQRQSWSICGLMALYIQYETGRNCSPFKNGQGNTVRRQLAMTEVYLTEFR